MYATGDERTSSFVRRFAGVGAPWYFGVDDLDALATEAGMIVVDKAKMTDLHRQHWPNRPLDVLALYDNYAFAH
jgi:hypothetical protein